jgi:IS5 family transposase
LLAWSATAANRNDITELIALVDAIPHARGRTGRPRHRPERVIADRGYDFDKCRRVLRTRGIAHTIARRGTGHRSGLGKHRRVVERTISHLHNKRRLLVCTDRTKATHDALLSLAACLLCYPRYHQSLC